MTKMRWLTTSRMGFIILCLAVPASGAEVDKKEPDSGRNTMGGLIRRLLPDEHERNHASVRNVFREVVAEASQATVRVLCDGVQSSLGVIVHADGYILTKASELDGRLECVLPDGRRLPAARRAERTDLDLALLKVKAVKLPVVAWSSSHAPDIGSFLATANIDGTPTTIGVVSAGIREIPYPRPVLGVELGHAAAGVRVNHVIPGTGAARAGIREGDVISSINGRETSSPDSLTDLIRKMQPGDRVKLALVRDRAPLQVQVTLSDMSRLGDSEQAELMDSLGGPLSRRRAGFSSVLQHDSVLRPRDCGGPVCDLDGKVVGLNIARASRVATYALPSAIVQPAVSEMLERSLASHVGGDLERAVTAAPVTAAP